MNDGGRENGRETEHDAGRKRGGDNFSRAIARIAVAQICENTGFHSFQESALEAFSEIAVRYLYDLGKTAHFYANLAGRTHCNVFDIIQGLEDLGSLQGYSGGSDVKHCLANSGAAQEISQYVSLTEDIPFARPIPHFPVFKNRKLIPSFLQIGETPAGKHIPAWLPAFPDPHTYVHTPVWNERPADPRKDKIEQAKQQRNAERSLLSLQQRLVYNASAVHASMDDREAGKEKKDVESNPFLAQPLQFGEKEVSSVILPAKILNDAKVENRVSVLEAFAPVIEAAKNGLHDSGDSERKILPNKRPTVHFKFRIGKKPLGTPLDLSLQKKDVGEESSWFGRDEEKDDKKKRAEQILKASMEDPQELAQL